MMDVNFFGTFSVTQAVVRRMKQRVHLQGDTWQWLLSLA